MARIHVSLVLLAALALGSSATAAGPSPAGGPPKPTGGVGPTPTPSDAMCPAPSNAKCIEKSYMGSICFHKHIAKCKPLVDAWRADFYTDRSLPTVETLKPNATEIPRDLQQGKYLAYEKRPSVAAATTPVFQKVRPYSTLTPQVVRTSTASDAPPVDRTQNVDPDVAKTVVRNQAWIDNGNTITSCEEYAYEKNYDYARYLDAIKACKGDSDCEIAITTMTGRPGIAARVLKDRQGNPLPHQIVLPEAAVPKNIFFTMGASYTPSKPLPPALAKQRRELGHEIDLHLEKGRKYYAFGDCPTCTAEKKWKNAWRWHAAMHTATKDVSDAERSIYADRWNAVLHLREAMSAARDRWIALLLEKHIEFQIEMPWDTQTQEIVEQIENVLEQPARDRSVVTRLEGLLGADFTAAELDAFENQMLGQRRTMSLGLFAAPSAASGAPRPKPAPSAVEKLQRKRAKLGLPATFDAYAPTLGSVGDPVYDSADPCDGPEDWPLVAFGAGPLFCQHRQLVIAEYQRHKAGVGSCVDYDDDACDWYPWNFEALTVDAVPSFTTEDADLAYCRTWQTPSMFPASDIKTVSERLRDEQQKLIELQQKMGQYVKDVGGVKRLRGTWGDADELGDPDLFAVDYSYALGWDAGLAGSNPSGRVCEVEGDVHGGIDVSATVAGRKKEVIDVTLAAKVEANTAKRKVHLELFGYQVYDSHTNGDWKTFGGTVWDPEVIPQFINTPIPSPPPRFDIYVGVPISGELWGELIYGIDTRLEGKAGGCSNPGLTIGGKLKPFFVANGRGQVGVGISGVVSAGVRASLNLITVELPFDMKMSGLIDGTNERLVFDSTLSMMFGTLSGYLAAYVEFLWFDEEWEFFRWKGFGPAELRLMPRLQTDVPLSALTR